jgi:hypothetical protein
LRLGIDKTLRVGMRPDVLRRHFLFRVLWALLDKVWRVGAVARVPRDHAFAALFIDKVPLDVCEPDAAARVVPEPGFRPALPPLILMIELLERHILSVKIVLPNLGNLSR